MFNPLKARSAAGIFVVALCAAAPLLSWLYPMPQAAANQEKTADPWSSTEIVRPADFAREIGGAKGADSPTVVYVGFRTLYEGGHVPGAIFHGTTSAEKGLAELKKWLADVPRSTNLVIYCGCCPFDRCPNIRPAYKALHEMGFAHVRVLLLPTSFAADWVEKGYAMEKGLP